MMILTWILFGLVIYYIIVNKDGHDFKFNSNKKKPDDILRERYVNGEIDEETYRNMKEVLKG